MEFNKFYKDTTGFEPYQYQEEVCKLLFDRKNVILNVPTGAGKTMASIMPFLLAHELYKTDFPQKMIYSLPLRTLCNSIYEDVNKLLSKTNYDGVSSIQTGEYNEDIYFENDIIFSTIDQTLSNFLCFPLALSDRQANINAGALIGSYLVFDEFHLLDSERSMATTLGMLRMLGNLTRCCIMTATLSEDFMLKLKEELPNYEIVTLNMFPNDRNKIKSLLPKKNKKKIYVSDNTISAKSIIDKHKEKSIIICNRVETAQKLYKDIINYEHITIEKSNIVCLHSRFFDKDRKNKEEKLKKLFGKKSNPKEHAILISTQVIEAGMDISCSVMHTEISPVNSFLQRSGRCSRFANEIGEIYIYDVLKTEEKELINIKAESKEDKAEIRKLNNKYLPYDKEVCKITLSVLKGYKTLDGNIPQLLIEQVLREKEQTIIHQLKESNFNYNKILNSWSDCSKNHYRNTIRDIQNVDITIISDEQCDEVAKYPFRYQSLGMYRFSLSSWLKKIISRDDYDRDDWLIKELSEVYDIFLENVEEVKYGLKNIPIDKYNNLPQRVFVNSKYFGYSKDFGFNWQYKDSNGNISPRNERKDQKDELKPLQKDTFFQHNMALLGVFENKFLGNNLNKLNFTFKELANYIEYDNLDNNDFVRLIKLMIILHDYGKLNSKWQNPMRKYQALKEGISLKEISEIIAHTDYDFNNENDKELGQKAGLNKRGAHAGIGAYVAQKIIEDEFDNDFIKSGISLAIARHHSPLTSTFGEFEISDSNYKAIKELLDKFNFDFELEQKESEGYLDEFQFDDWEKEQIAYLFFVRILRLCDQKATENYKKYFNK